VPSLRTASRRQLTLFVAISGVLLAALAAVFVPVPYVILSPGPTLNTLGKGPGGRSLIQITGHPTYPTFGHLNLVTVSFQGGPSNSLNIFAALRAWLTPHEAVVPQEELFVPGQTQQQVVQQDTQQMTSSQQTSTAAALCVLKIKFQVVDTVAVVAKGLPADGVLRRGDVITAVDGKPVTCKASAASLIRARSPGDLVTLTIARTAGGDIGGPSAGLMFALGIVDKLTPGNLTGGRFVAGTGEISADGTISAIGGIQQKMAGARQAGATLFLTPAANCADTAGAVPAGMRLVKVRNLAGAVSALHALEAGRSVPSC